MHFQVPLSDDDASPVMPLPIPPVLLSRASNALAWRRIPIPRGRWPLAGLVAALGLGGWLLLDRLVLQPQAAQRLAATIETVRVERADLGASTDAGGVVTAVRQINLSPNVSSRIERLYVREGDRVRAGQLVAQMESDELRARLGQVQALRDSAMATARAASARRQRHEMLLASGAISLDLMEELRNEERQARIKVQEASYQIQESAAALRLTRIYAPFGGIITRLYAQEGQFVTPTTAASEQAGATSTSIAELSNGLEVLAKVPEASLTEIAVGQKAEISTDAFPNQVFQGTVTRISPRAVIENEVNSFPVSVAIHTGLSRLKPAMNVQVRFVANPLRNALVIPVAALTETEQGRRGVFRQSQDGRLSFVTVATGRISGDQAQILKGLKLGDRVLISAPPAGVNIPGYTPKAED